MYIKIVREYQNDPSRQALKTQVDRHKVLHEVLARLNRAGLRDFTRMLNSELKSCRQSYRATQSAKKYLRYSRKGIAVEAPVLSTGYPEALIVLRQRLRDQREKRRAKTYREVWSGALREHIPLVAGTHEKPGTILEFVKLRKSRKLFETKRPLSEERHVGIELEFCSELEAKALAQLFADQGLEKHITLKADGSVRPVARDHHGHEINIIAPLDQYKSIVDRVCDVLGGVAYINRTCGMHVHIDARQGDPAMIFNNLCAAQSVLYAMQPVSRRDNSYCKRTRGRDFLKQSRSGRYKGINAAAYRKFKTIEVRLHAGTIDPIKIKNWIDILHTVADAPLISGRVASARSLARLTSLAPMLQLYVKERVAKFASPEVDDAATEQAA